MGKKSDFQRPHSHWSETHRRSVSRDGRVYFTPRNDASEFSVYIEFFCNFFTAWLLVYWLASWGGIFDHVIFGGILGLGIMVQQNECPSRWIVRLVSWGIFWGMFYFGLHWVPLFHFGG